MISLASSVQTCMRFAGKQRAFPFSSLFPPPPPPLSLFQPPYDLPSPSLPSCSTGHDHPWMVLFHPFVPQTYPPPHSLYLRVQTKEEKKKKREKERLAPNGYDAAREYCSRKSPYRSTNGGSFIIILALYRRPFFSRPRHCLASLLAHATSRLSQKGWVIGRTRPSRVILRYRNRDTVFLHFLHFLL